MASLDDVYDILDKLEEKKVEYLLITIQKGKKIGKSDVFFNLENDNSLRILAQGLSVFQKEVDKKRENDEFN